MATRGFDDDVDALAGGQTLDLLRKGPALKQASVDEAVALSDCPPVFRPPERTTVMGRSEAVAEPQRGRLSSMSAIRSIEPSA